MAPGKRWMDFNYDAYGMGIQPDGSDWQRGFGFKDLEAAQNQGYSNPQIRILAQRAEKQGRPVGKKMKSWLSSNTQAGPWDYGGVGGAEFGQADLNMALGQGADYNKIKEYTDYARKWGIGVGIEAEDWMRDERQQTFQEQLLQQQQQQAAEATRIQEEMAARVARVKGNSPTGVGGNAAFRGSRLSITEAGGRRGTRRFSRPGTQFMNTLNSGNTAGTTTKSTLNI